MLVYKVLFNVKFVGINESLTGLNGNGGSYEKYLSINNDKRREKNFIMSSVRRGQFNLLFYGPSYSKKREIIAKIWP